MKRFRSQKGAALLEAAITVPVILLICVGIFEFGRAYQTWQVLTNAAREGARAGIIIGTTDDQIKSRAVTYMTGGGLLDANANMITVTHNIALTGSDTATQVQIDYPFNFIVLQPVVRLVNPSATVGAPITMHSTALMRNES